ncbi:hypothetical protein N7532_005051 [Penicillium argentinense]|uniref:Uncharacterized protein n=1 Tax=Penicillium argentinense TaxID=1131581 RepID=A0A9W9FDF3_9EURO|nr:uncharacterized protein N7532_005051 [Penicillium argentinense]KAJ5098050.1 hypothetical protein N7532_005051 [Penicillium argentinense]
MAPRRGSGGYSSSYWSYSNPWAQETKFYMEMWPSKTMFIADFAFDVLFALALIAFLTWACLIRNHGQMKGIILGLIFWLFSEITDIIYEIFFLAEAVVTQYYNIDIMLQIFFSVFTYCIIVFVFYNLIHRMLNRLTDSGKPYATVAIVHWIILGIVTTVSLASWALSVVIRVKFVQDEYFSDISRDLNKVDSARAIILWLISLEIFAWTVFVAMKAGSHRFTSRSPVYALLAGSICWFAFCLMYAVIYIRYYLEVTYIYPSYLNLVTSVLTFIFGIGTLVGILLCCQKWRHVDDSADKAPATMQYPYAGAPYQPYPLQQQWQPYPGQPQPQYPQQFQQPVQEHQQQPQK